MVLNSLAELPYLILTTNLRNSIVNHFILETQKLSHKKLKKICWRPHSQWEAEMKLSLQSYCTILWLWARNTWSHIPVIIILKVSCIIDKKKQQLLTHSLWMHAFPSLAWALSRVLIISPIISTLTCQSSNLWLQMSVYWKWQPLWILYINQAASRCKTLLLMQDWKMIQTHSSFIKC